MKDLIDTTEMYLKTIVELEEQGIVPLRARIAERLEHSGPTVSQTVARMERDGLLVVDADRHLELTDEGRELAIAVMRKHRLAERLLSDVIGLDWELVHEEACRWEHVMSQPVEERRVSLLPEIQTSPYGNPIPGLEELGIDDEAEPEHVSLVAALKKHPKLSARIAWLGEPIQVDQFLLGQFKRTQVQPGAHVQVSASADGEYMTVAVPGHDEVLDLPVETAENVFVTDIRDSSAD